METSNNKVLITGGATGIGFGLARRFIRENNTVIICGRRSEALNQAKAQEPSLITWQGDLSTTADRERLFAWVSEHHPDMNVLVNNAGIQQWMSLDTDDFFARAKQELAINVEAPLHLTQLFIRHAALRAILNVTSGLAFVPLAKVPTYSATKAFLRSFTLSMRELLKSKNIEVIEVIPPALNTDLGGKGIHDQAPPVEGFIDAVFSQLREGKQELTYGFSENMIKAGPEELREAFNRMNQVR